MASQFDQVDSPNPGAGNENLSKDDERARRRRVGPDTDENSISVILRAERKDSIQLKNVVQELREEEYIPSIYEVRERTDTFYGPELLLRANDSTYRLTAPGPDSQLYLWKGVTDNRGYLKEWARIAEVMAEICTTPQYEFCDQCGKPIRSLDHERFARIGQCPYR